MNGCAFPAVVLRVTIPVSFRRNFIFCTDSKIVAAVDETAGATIDTGPSRNARRNKNDKMSSSMTSSRLIDAIFYLFPKDGHCCFFDITFDKGRLLGLLAGGFYFSAQCCAHYKSCDNGSSLVTQGRNPC